VSVPSAFGAPVLAARIRVAPEDFRVEELPAEPLPISWTRLRA
jgi:hypothetical protein